MKEKVIDMCYRTRGVKSRMNQIMRFFRKLLLAIAVNEFLRIIGRYYNDIDNSHHAVQIFEIKLKIRKLQSTLLKKIVLYCIVLHCIALYCIVLYCVALYYIVVIVLYCIALYCIVLYCTL